MASADDRDDGKEPGQAPVSPIPAPTSPDYSPVSPAGWLTAYQQPATDPFPISACAPASPDYFDYSPLSPAQAPASAALAVDPPMPACAPASPEEYYSSSPHRPQSTAKTPASAWERTAEGPQTEADCLRMLEDEPGKAFFH